MMIRSLLVLSVIGLAAAGPAAALTGDEVRQCNAMAATFEAKEAEINRLKAAQAALAAEAEILGEEWELLEEQRRFSARHAASADEAKAAFETARDAANRAGMDLNSKVQMFQADAAAFNAKCAAD
ncbi:MAG: hypothetical protein AAFR33_00995 [Pseudomonadota bacterium]